MAVKGDNYEDDPEAELRNRIATQYADPTASAGASAGADQPIDPAPFYGNTGDNSVSPTNESYTNPETPRPYTPTATTEGSDVTSGNPAAVTAPTWSTSVTGNHGFVNTAQAPAYTPGQPGSYQEGAPNDPNGFNATAGWDTGKLNDPNVQSPKYQFMRAMEAAGLDPVTATNNPASVVAAINRMYPKAGVTMNTDGTINWPGLGPIDYSIDSGKGGWFFDPINTRGQAGPNAGATTAAAQHYGGFDASAGGGSNGAPGGVWSSDFLNQLRSMLMQRMQVAGQPVDEQAAGINQALTGARDEATRSNDASRTALAERLYAQGGLNTDAIGKSVQQSNERTGTALGTLRAQLVMKEYDRKQSELQSLMQLAIQSGDAESARMIQEQLAYLQAQVQREGIGATLGMFQQQQNTIAGNPGTFS